MAISRVRIYEVGPRDGLQNEARIVSARDKIEFIRLLSLSGLTNIEATAFVRSVSQMADAQEVYTSVRDFGTRMSALVPNRKGMENALASGLREAAIFTAASETFTRKNINSSIEESFSRFKEVMQLAADHAIPVRGYVSTVVECPYEGRIAPQKVAEICDRLIQAGVYEISLGETIGVAVPNDISRLLDEVTKKVPPEKLAGHYHDTRGTALSNVFRSLDYGLSVFDSSAGGLGGCPYAPGASGNLATEDLLYALHRSKIETGVDLGKIADASEFIRHAIAKEPASRVFAAIRK